MARYLVVCHITAQSQALQDELQAIARTDPAAEFTVLAPATPRTYWKAWDIVQETERAGALALEVGRTLRSHNLNVVREIAGSREPMLAIDDELRDSPGYAEIIISTLPSETSRWLRRDFIQRARERFDLPVRHVVAADIQVEPGQMEEQGDFAEEHRLPSTPQRASGGIPASIQRTLDAITRTGSRVAESAASVAVQERPVDRNPVAMDVAPNVLGRQLARNRPIAEAFWALQMQLEQRSGLEPEIGELVALRVAQLRHFTQLWQEHVLIARALGIPDQRIAAVEHWRSAEHVQFGPRERAILGYADAVCEDATNVDGVRRSAEQYLDETEMMGLTLLVGFHRMSGSFEHSLGLPTDGPFVGWALFRGVASGQHL